MSFGPPDRFSKWLHRKDQALACKQLWVSCFLSITTIKVYLRTVAMGTVVLQYVRHLGGHFRFFKKFMLHKIAANFTEISRKQVLAALKGYSSGQRHFSEINVKLAEKNKYATHFVQRSLEMCKNK